MQEDVLCSELYYKQAPVCCWAVWVHFLCCFGLRCPELGYSEVLHVPGKASGCSWNIYPRREETWGKLHGKLKGPNKERGWVAARMTNTVTKQNFFLEDEAWPEQWNCCIHAPRRNQLNTTEDLMGWVFFLKKLQEENRVLPVVLLNVLCETKKKSFIPLPWQHCLCQHPSFGYLLYIPNNEQNKEGESFVSFMSCTAETWPCVCLRFHSLGYHESKSWQDDKFTSKTWSGKQRL